jgi:hypothetical protein
LVKYFQNGRHKGSNAKKGLGQVTPTVGQVVIGFATSAGDTADDGNGNMSPYARALSKWLQRKDDIRNILGKVAIDVSKYYKQNPIYRANLASNVCLNGTCSKIEIKKEEKFEKKRPIKNKKEYKIHAINWNDSASFYKDNLDQIFVFKCPSKGKISYIYGTDTYTTDSKICTTAVHAGKITAKDGGVVAIEIKTGEDRYIGSKKNGVVSNNYGKYNASFIFVENPIKN